MFDVPLKDIVDLMLRVKTGGLTLKRQTRAMNMSGRYGRR